MGRKRVLFHCNNQAVTSIWDLGLSCSADLMKLVHSPFFFATKQNFHVLIKHIDNSIADSLSHIQME